MQHLAQAFDARTAPIVQLPYEQGRVDAAAMVDMARGHAYTHHPTTPAHDGLRADALR